MVSWWSDGCPRRDIVQEFSVIAESFFFLTIESCVSNTMRSDNRWRFHATLMIELHLIDPSDPDKGIESRSRRRRTIAWIRAVLSSTTLNEIFQVFAIGSARMKNWAFDESVLVLTPRNSFTLIHIVNHGESRWWFPRVTRPSETLVVVVWGMRWVTRITLIRSECGWSDYEDSWTSKSSGPARSESESGIAAV